MWFTCNWIIDSNGVGRLDFLFDIASKLKARLRWAEITLENELIVWQFFLEVDSEKTLDEFVRQAKPYFELAEWQPIEESDARGWSTPPKFSEGFAISLWLEGRFNIASMNEYLLNKMKNDQSRSSS